MSDADWRELERKWVASPTDQTLLARAIAACRRAGVPVQAEMRAARVNPARTFDSREDFYVEVVRPDSTQSLVGETPAKSPVRIPKHRTFIVVPIATDRTPKGSYYYRELYANPAYRSGLDVSKQAVGDALPRVVAEVASQGIPGLAVDRSDVEDRHLAQLAQLPHLEALRLQSCQHLSTRALEHVAASLPHLAQLELVDLVGFLTCSLEPLHALRELAFVRLLTRLPTGALLNVPPGLVELTVTGDERLLRDVARFERLRKLNVHNSQLSDAGLPALEGLERLVELDLSGTQVGDDGLARLLPRLGKLETLSLERCDSVTDRGFEAVAACSSLKELHVGFCRSVTSEGFAKLASLSGLERLYAGGGKKLQAIQATGRAAVARALPRCKILGAARTS